MTAMFKENFIRLCNEKGIAPTTVCAAVGLSNAAFSNWSDTSVPRPGTVKRIADYFEVSPAYLLGSVPDPDRAGGGYSVLAQIEEVMEGMTSEELLELNRKLAEVLSRKK